MAVIKARNRQEENTRVRAVVRPVNKREDS
jgi:hypothetical protein